MRTDFSFYISIILVLVLAAMSPAMLVAASTSPSSFEEKGRLTCEDMANRQIDLADTQIQQNSYQRALRVLNRAAENCDIPAVREKIVEVLNQWYGTASRQGASALREFINVVSNQQYISSYQRNQFEARIEESVSRLIQERFQRGNLQSTHRLCRSFSSHVPETFELNYYCGTAAHDVGARNTAVRSFEWMWENWTEDQSFLEWEELATTLEELYLETTQFENAYEISKELSIYESTPERLLTSLISVRGIFLEPLLHVGSSYIDLRLTSEAREYVSQEMTRINFPTFVESFYVISRGGEPRTVLYGEDELSPPRPSLLDQASGSTSLLRSSGSRAWLVSSTSDGYLALQYDQQTSPEENVRLESLLENVQSEEAWQDLYNLEFQESYPALGSAVATLVGGAYLGDLNMDPFEKVFDATPALMYYCIQDDSGDILMSHAFSQSNLGYGTGGWQRTSNTPALFHHSIEYNEAPIREVVWPRYVNEEWSGVIRVGIARR